MAHAWSFFRAGGVDQVALETGADIAHLRALDQKLWVALACPTRGLEFDEHSLDLVDTDHDGRIRAPEVIAAAEWLCARLRDPQDIFARSSTLALDAIATGTPEQDALREEARAVLQLLGKPEAGGIDIEDVADRSRLLQAMPLNGDGIITVAALSRLDDPPGDRAALAEVLQHIAETQGAVQDANGDAGVDRAHAESYFAQVDALQAWHRRAQDDPSLTPLGEGTPAAFGALEAVRAKVEDFFARCRVAAFDERAAAALNATLDDFKAMSAQLLDTQAPALAALPLARVAPGAPLPLQQGLNPAWALQLSRLRSALVEPLLGAAKDLLREAEWHWLQQSLAACAQWMAERPQGPLAELPLERIAALSQPDLRAAVLELIARDEAVGPRSSRIAELEKLLYLKRDLLTLLENFVSFAAFYRREGAIFQAGRLHLDGRSCDLSVRVDDAARHALLAGMAKAYLAYCSCTRGGEKMQIVSAFTAGDVDFLFVGRNGIFYDRQGRDWDATITRVIENPTSVAQAFLSPYKKFLRMVEEQVARRAAASEGRAQAGLAGLAARVAVADKPGSAPAGAAAPAAAGSKDPARRFDVGTVAALGVALGSLSAVAVGVFGKFVDLGWWIPMAVIGIVLAVSGPSMLIAWLKLRQRSLGPILDAGGWAINGRMRVNVRLGGSLSRGAHIPAGARRRLQDPYAERHGQAWLLGTGLLALALLLMAWRFALLDPLLPVSLRRADTIAVPAAAEAPVPAATGAPLPAASAVPAATP